MNDDFSFQSAQSSLGDTLSDLTLKNGVLAEQLSTLTSGSYASALSLTMDNQIAAFDALGSLTEQLPVIDANISPLVESAREATLAIAPLVNEESVLKIAEFSTNIDARFNEILPTSTILEAGERLAGAMELVAAPALKLVTDLENVIEPMKTAQFTIQSNLLKISELSVLAEESLSNLQVDQIGSAISLTGDLQASLNDSFLDITSGYSDFIGALSGNFEAFANFNPQIARLTSEEYFNNANLLGSISLAESEDTTVEQLRTNDILIENERNLNYYLSQIDADLIDLWRGASEALKSDNPDSIRHFGVSFRELLTHVYHALAPDEQVREWTNEKDDYHENKPTRRARLRYICREINDETFEKFVDKDIAAFLEFLNLFQGATHKVKPELSRKQLIAMKCRAESAIKYLIVISKN